MSFRGANALAPFLKPSPDLSVKANEVLRRELQRIISCGNLAHEYGIVMEHKQTSKIKDVGLMHCHSRWCQSCLAHKEILQREKLENTIDGFELEFSDSAVGLLTTTLPPLNEMLNLYSVESLDEYRHEATFRRFVMDLFVTSLRESKTCSFIRGWFRSEEQTISKEKYLKGKLSSGNNLNLHFHQALFLRSLPDNLLDEFEMSCFFYLKWLRCYRQACKKFRIKPKDLKEPYKDDRGVIRGGVVFLFKKSLKDSGERDWFTRYIIKKSGQWTLAAETTGKSRKKPKGSGLNMESIIASNRKKYFKENAAKMLVLINYGAREFHYSKVKNGRIIIQKKTKRARKTPSNLMREALIK